jgi:hypothetical protein
VPATRRNSAIAASAGRAVAYGRLLVIASNASHTAMTRAPKGISSPTSPSG